MRIKLQALTEHIHGFLLNSWNYCISLLSYFPSHYLFYFFTVFFCWFHLQLLLMARKKSSILSAISLLVLHVPFCCFLLEATLGEAVLLILSVAIMLIRIPSPSSKNRRLWNCGWKRNWIRWSFWFAKCRLFRVFCSSLFIALLLKRMIFKQYSTGLHLPGWLIFLYTRI